MASQPDTRRSPEKVRVQAFLNTLKPVSAEDWALSDQYHSSFLIPKDEVLDAVLINNAKQGLPNISVSKSQGKFLNLLVKSIRVKRVLEIGTLGG